MKSTSSPRKASQRNSASVAQRATAGPEGVSIAPKNRTGLPDRLKAGVERLSGLSLDDVRVHFNSSRPAQMQALAYTQGTQIHVAPEQERHLPHEAWHVVQQKQGRVKPTTWINGLAINDEPTLEQEAQAITPEVQKNGPSLQAKPTPTQVIQRAIGYEYELDTAVSERREKPLLLGNPKITRLQKGEVIADKGGYLVTADEIPLSEGGGSDVEIIIKELDDRNPKGKNNLIKVVQDLVTFLTELNNETRLGKEVKASTFGGSDNVYVYGGMDGGILQASVGMNLEALSKFRSGEMGQYHENRLNIMGNYLDPLGKIAKHTQTVKAFYLRGYGANPTAYNAALYIVEAKLPKLAPWYQKEIATVMSLVVMSAVNARVNSPLPYPKAGAGEMLARTDFTNIIEQLSGPAKIRLQDSELWMDMILKTITILSGKYIDKEVSPEDRVFPEGSIKPHGKEKVDLRIKFKDWLPRMVGFAAKDMLTEKNYPSEYGGKTEGKWLESIGGFGSKTDPGLGENDNPRPIFEFRKKLQVPLRDLLDVTIGIWELVNLAHKR